MEANQNKSNASTFTKWIMESVILKAFGIGIIILLLLIPQNMISSLINERSYRQKEAISEVSQKWGNAQTLIGPVLYIPYKKHYEEDHEKKYKTSVAFFLPEELLINGEVVPEEKKRGIFKIPIYTYNGTIQGHFIPPAMPEWEDENIEVLYQQAKVLFGLTDLAGINNEMNIQWNEKSIPMSPGLPKNNVLKKGIHAPVPISNTKMPFELNISLNGTQQLSFAPVGKNTEAKLNSTWPTPSFNGSYLTDNNNVSNEGFEAYWKVLSLNRNYPQKWLDGNNYNLHNEVFGVELFKGNDHYKLNTRSIKYAILIILLIFTTYFFFEILKKQRVHPFQYIMIGLAISIFYLLLLSFSEHYGFNAAYGIGSVAVIGLILIYSHSILKNNKLLSILGFALAAVFSFIYIILQMEDFALLAGSIGLFVVLATVMIVSRKVNWYKLRE